MYSILTSDRIFCSKIKVVTLYSNTRTTFINYINYIQRKDIEYELYGDGDYVSEIIKKSRSDPRVRYFGTKPNSQVIAAEEQASILINPRRNDQLFSKYCFPSKIAEYLCCGRPILCYKLDGISPEYDKYLNYVVGDSPAELATSILALLDDLGNAEIKADQGKEFILKNRNYMVQGEKICRFIQEVLSR